MSRTPSADRRLPPVEVQTLARLDRALRRRTTLAGLRIQDLDLTRRSEQLLAHTDLEGLVVLGGRLTPQLETHLRTHGAIVFPTDPHAPIDPYRATLYHPDELYADLLERGYAATPDAGAYAWFRDAASRHDVYVTLLRAIHDDSISDALDEFLEGRPVVGVMGGHAVPRGGERYAEAARLGRRLAAAGMTVATGGGPGAMEAANLGAFSRDHDEMTATMADLREVPSFQPSIDDWARVAVLARRRLAAGTDGPQTLHRGRSVGIPTWFYGHEPPNVFCHAVAKYFSNAIREDGLLARCTAGLVVLPGEAGTTQEVFQAATRLYYPDERPPAPLVLVGRRHWTEELPVWPALVALARTRAMAGALHLVEDVEEAAAVVTG